MAPDASPGVRELLAAAVRHHQAGRLAAAEPLYRQILQADPGDADALHLLGVLAHQQDRNDIAVELIGKAIAHNGRMPAFHNNLGNALKAQRRLEAAVASYSRALSYKPDYVEAHYNLGVTLQEQGKLQEAAASYARALSYSPDHVAAHCNLGNTLQAQGRLDEAVASYQRALARKPNYAEAHGNLGNVLKAQGKLDESVACYRRALSYKPDHAEAHNNLGIVLLEQGLLDEAADSCARAVALRPDYAEAHNNLGNALKEQGKSQQALACYRRALALEPDNAGARLNLAMALIPVLAHDVAESVRTTDDFERSLAELGAWSSAHPGKLGTSVGRTQPFYLAYRPRDVTALLGRYGDLVCTAAAAYWRPQAAEQPSVKPPTDRIRLLLVSGQLRQHPVWDVVARGIIAQIDRRQFETILYHTGSITDQDTAWAATHVDRFVQGPKPMQLWLDEIKRDRPDVIFYPEVGMDPATCALAALRLAPLQIAGWGHPVTTGLPTMDLFLSAELLEGIGAERHYREKLVRLPGTGVYTQLPALESQPWGGPARKPQVVRFALCQQPIKFDPADDVLLARIAKAVGPSEFWLAAPNKLNWATASLRERIAASFRAEGLDPDQYLRVMPWLARGNFLGFLDDMDLYLDCPAFSGYTTAWQAIHRGLPIVTVEGEFLRQRLAAGLLRQIGITDGIAQSREQYVQIAVAWAQQCRHSGPREERRAAMRAAAPKADGNRAAVTAFEQTLLEAVRGHRS